VSDYIPKAKLKIVFKHFKTPIQAIFKIYPFNIYTFVGHIRLFFLKKDVDKDIGDTIPITDFRFTLSE